MSIRNMSLRKNYPGSKLRSSVRKVLKKKKFKMFLIGDQKKFSACM